MKVWTRWVARPVSETLLVPLSGRNSHASAAAQRLLGSADPVIFPLGQLTDGRSVLEKPYELLALAGAPPTDELGYGFATVVALLGRPNRVALIDLRTDAVVSSTLRGYLLRTIPFAISQVAFSALAVLAQRAAIPVARRVPRVRAVSGDLRNLVYLLPAVGSSSGIGGSVTHAHGVIRALRNEGVAVEAFTTDAAIAETARKEPQPPCEWHVVRIPRVAKAVVASATAASDGALTLAALGAVRRADAIYQRHTGFSLIGALLAHLTRKPLILEYNSPAEFVARYWSSMPTRLSGGIGRCEDASLAAAARIIVVSEIARRSLVERGIAAERIVVNPNGVDVDRFATGGGAEIRRELRFDDSAIVAGFVGSFGPWHGAPVLARAFASVAAQVPHLRLLLVGDGQELGPTLQIVREAGLEGRTTVVGQVPPPAVPAYLDACDVLVAPHVPLPDGADFFGSPTKLFEYMAAGKAIVASRLGQIGEVLEPGKTAILVTPGDADDLAAGLKRLAGDSNLRSELGRNVRRTAVTRHSWELNASRVVEAYHSLVEESRSDLSNGQTRE
jgi:glycosyltransferase involved in cell wall biosynthesis